MQTERTYTEEQERLFNDNIGLVYDALKRLHAYSFRYPYVLEDAFIALWIAVLTFDNSKKIKFSTYASTCIENAIKKYYKYESVQKRKNFQTISYDTSLSFDEKGASLLDYIIDESASMYVNEFEDNDEAMYLLNFVLNVLNDKRKFVFLN